MMDLTRFQQQQQSASSNNNNNNNKMSSLMASPTSLLSSMIQSAAAAAAAASASSVNNMRDEREGCRSLICDANGIIIAEVVYRCMICSQVSDSITDAKVHYHTTHIDTDVEEPRNANGHHSGSHYPEDDPLIFPDDEDGDLMPGSSEEDNESSSYYRQLNYHSNRHHRPSNVGNNNNDPLNLSLSLFDGSMPTSGGKVKSTSGRKKKESASSKAHQDGSSEVAGIRTEGTNGTCTIKSGYITCPVCSCTKFYTTLQRRYGQFSCVGCYRFFKEFFVKPKRFGCPNLGSCSLDQRTKCKACWIKKCIDTYTVDAQRKALLIQNRPLKKNCPPCTATVKSIGQSAMTPLSADKKMLPPSLLASPQLSQTLQVKVPSGMDADNSFSMPSPIQDMTVNENETVSMDDPDDDETGMACPMPPRSPESHGFDSPSKRPRSDPINYETEDADPSGMGGGAGDSLGDDNSLDDVEDLPMDDDQENNNGTSSLLVNVSQESNNTSNNLRDSDSLDGQSILSSPGSSSVASSRPSTRAGVTPSTASPARRKTSGRIKNWCCLKCTNCLADDCGKCINCLDRPKFGGPFIRKQRCLYKKCLMKTKPTTGNGSGTPSHPAASPSY